MWEDVEPIVKFVPFAKAWIKVNADGKVRVNISLSEAMLNDCGRPLKANIQVGVKDGHPMVRMVWAPDGKFTVKAMELGGARISNIPRIDPVPDGAREAEACDVIKKDKTEAIFVLPVAEWQKQVAQKPPTVASTKAPVPPISKSASKLVAADYLKSKGVRCSRLAGDWWMIDGVRVPRIDALARVNEFRRNAGLASLGLDDIE